MPPPIANYYHVLGVSRNCTKEQLKKAYYQLAKKFHPDTVTTSTNRQKQEEQFRLITTAYQTLSNPSERSMYDFRLSVSLDGDSVEFMGNNGSRLSQKSPFPPQSSSSSNHANNNNNNENADPFAARREMYNYMFRQETPEEASRKRAHRMRMMRRGFMSMGGIALLLFIGKFYLVKKVYFDHIESLDKQAEHALQRTSEGKYYVSKKDYSGSYYSRVPASTNMTNQSQQQQQEPYEQQQQERRRTSDL